MAANRRRNVIYGNDLYRHVESPGTRQPLEVSYWDLWIVLVLTGPFGGNWDEMIDRFRTKKEGLSRRDEAEGLLNHIRLLRQALAQEGLTAEDVLSGADPVFLKTQARKARRKVLEMAFQRRERSS